MTTHPHFAIQTFALHLFLQRTQRLIDVIVANLNFHGADVSVSVEQTNKFFDTKKGVPSTAMERPDDLVITENGA